MPFRSESASKGNGQPDSAAMEISAAGDIPTAGRIEGRAVALDILRGLAILMMVFANHMPFTRPLPRWLFHAQEPPTYDQNHQIVHLFDPNLPGLTFVDLVFPFFLFALGAAIPLALSRSLDRGESVWRTIGGGVRRMALLVWFALYIGQIRPGMLHVSPSTSTWLIAILGYALLYPMFVRLPITWSSAVQLGVRTVGYGGSAILLYVLTVLRYYPHHIGFALWRTDVIIVVLADMALFATVIWVLTRNQPLYRLAAISLLFAIRLGSSEPGWLQSLWNYAPPNTGWVFAWDYLKYLFIVIPGTMAGDLVYQWTRKHEPASINLMQGKLIGFIVLSVLLVAGVLVGLETRKLWETTVFCFGVCGTSWWLLSKPTDSTQQLVQSLALWGCYWLIMGILIQPFEGGIKKDPSTMSYYFVTTGLAFFLLSSFIVLTAIFKVHKPFSLLRDCGQNPMIAYVTLDNLFLPLFALIKLQPVLDRIFLRPWMGVLLTVVETTLLAYFVSWLTNKRVFWRT